MKTKDWKAMAEIMRNSNLLFYPNGHKIVCSKLSDHFEKEERDDVEKWKKEQGVKLDVLQLEITRLDNRRKQFLKECGVENE